MFDFKRLDFVCHIQIVNMNLKMNIFQSNHSTMIDNNSKTESTHLNHVDDEVRLYLIFYSIYLLFIENNSFTFHRSINFFAIEYICIYKLYYSFDIRRIKKKYNITRMTWIWSNV
jgi:hypothetical protein